MQNAMDDNSMQLFFIRAAKLFGVESHGVQTDEEVAGNALALAIVERDDVSIVVVLQVLSVHLEYLLVIAEDIGYLSHSLAIAVCHGLYPGRGEAARDGRHLHIYNIIGNHILNFSD
jgi:hypothetical protein